MIKTRKAALYEAAIRAAIRLHPEADLVARWDYAAPSPCTVFLTVPGGYPEPIATGPGIAWCLKLAEAALSARSRALSEAGEDFVAVPF